VETEINVIALKEKGECPSLWAWSAL